MSLFTFCLLPIQLTRPIFSSFFFVYCFWYFFVCKHCDVLFYLINLRSLKSVKIYVFFSPFSFSFCILLLISLKNWIDKEKKRGQKGILVQFIAFTFCFFFWSQFFIFKTSSYRLQCFVLSIFGEPIVFVCLFFFSLLKAIILLLRVSHPRSVNNWMDRIGFVYLI